MSRSIRVILITIFLLPGCALDWKKPHQAVDSGSGGREGGSPGQPEAGGSEGGMSGACTSAKDCGDPERFACTGHACVEYACHASKPCLGSDACEGHACVPFKPPERLPTGYAQTNGGGEASSSQYRLRWSAGTPQPFGVASSAKYRVTLGPGAGRP